jgi:hypothetical protein
MKKILLVLVLIPLLMSVGITGCSKDEDNNNNDDVTGVPNEMDFEFVLNFMNNGRAEREDGRFYFS